MVKNSIIASTIDVFVDISCLCPDNHAAVSVRRNRTAKITRGKKLTVGDTDENSADDRMKRSLPSFLQSPAFRKRLIFVLVAAIVLTAALALAANVSQNLGPPPTATTTTTTTPPASDLLSPKDKFGINRLYPTAPGGIEWSATWDDGQARTLGNQVDPADGWFDTTDGDGTYTIDGKGTLTASGDVVRMYVRDPAKEREWSENLEITLYFKRIDETQIVSYSGLQVFARTNHGMVGDENINYCDDRGYGGLVGINGVWALEKESAHHLDNGYTDVARQRPSGALPKDTWIGFKYVLRNMDGGSKVKLELYRDTTGGVNGGNWQKVTEFVDDGKNFGVGRGECRPGVDAGLPLIHSFINDSSETKKPMLSVYARHEYGTMEYSNFSIREIDPLP